MAFALPHFQWGSLTVLPGDWQKRVEELQAEDFLGCTASTELRLGLCLVQGIWKSPHAGFACLQVYLGDQDRQVSAEVVHPFFTLGRGWVSCCLHTTFQLYQLPCQQLAVGDVCIV